MGALTARALVLLCLLPIFFQLFLWTISFFFKFIYLHTHYEVCSVSESHVRSLLGLFCEVSRSLLRFTYTL